MQCRTSLSLLRCGASRPYIAAAALANIFCFRHDFSTTTCRSDSVQPQDQTLSHTASIRGTVASPLHQPAEAEYEQVLALCGEELAHQLMDFKTANPGSDQWRSHMRLIAGIKSSNALPNRSKKNTRQLSLPDLIHDMIEYRPEIIQLLPEMTDKRNSPLPWLPERIGTMNGRQLLGEEILRFSRFMQPSHEEKVARDGVFEYVKFVLEDCTGGIVNGGKIELEPHGSVRSGLALTASDIDLRIFSQLSDGNPATFRTLADSLQWAVFKPYIVHDKELVANRYRHSRWPIISCQHRPSGLDIQMVVTKRSTKQQAATAQYLKEFPLLVPMYVVLRQTLNHRGLLDVFYGGPGSYPLLMMIVAALSREPTGREEVTPEALTSHLLHFFQFYSSLDTRATGLTVDPPLEFDKHSAADAAKKVKRKALRDKQTAAAQSPVAEAADSQLMDAESRKSLVCRNKMARANPSIPYLLTLQDPADHNNDLGCRAYAIKHIQATFAHLHQTLLAGIRRVDESLGQSGGHESILLPLVGYCYETYAERRSKAEEFGRYVLAMRAKGEKIRSSGPEKPSKRLENVPITEASRVPSPFS